VVEICKGSGGEINSHTHTHTLTHSHTHTTDIHTHTPHTYTNSHRQRDRKTVRDSVTISNNTFTGIKYIKSFDFNFDHLMTSHIQFLSDVNDVLLF